jgi:hypothetical protein
MRSVCVCVCVCVCVYVEDVLGGMCGVSCNGYDVYVNWYQAEADAFLSNWDHQVSNEFTKARWGCEKGKHWTVLNNPISPLVVPILLCPALSQDPETLYLPQICFCFYVWLQVPQFLAFFSQFILSLFCHIFQNRKGFLFLIIYFITSHIIKLLYLFWLFITSWLFSSLWFHIHRKLWRSYLFPFWM